MEATIVDKHLGGLIKELRESRLPPLSQRALAQKLRLSQSIVSNWENGVAIPPAAHLHAIVDALKIDEVERVRLVDTHRQSELRSAIQPRTIDYILHDAAEFLDSNPGTTIWMLGPENLPVLEVGTVREVWVRNLERPVSYHLIWVLDWVDPDMFGVALPHFAQIADAAATKCVAEGRALGAMGRMHFHAVTVESNPSAATIAVYRRFCEALNNERGNGDALLEVEPYYQLSEVPDAFAEQRVALHTATERLVHIWQPETSLILYDSPRIATPPVANIRFMPVSEQIHTKASGVDTPMYWLAPRGAARLKEAVSQFASALGALAAIYQPSKDGGVP